jgi:hypothetical protein
MLIGDSGSGERNIISNLFSAFYGIFVEKRLVNLTLNFRIKVYRKGHGESYCIPA